MKKRIAFFTTLICLLVSSLAFFTGCGEKAEAKATLILSTETRVVIKVDSVKGNAMLKHALDSVVGDNFSYELSNGMVSKVNGVENPADWSKCWMIYTSDTEFSNNTYGTVTYEGLTFGSAILGVNDLPVTVNAYYVLDFASFS